MKKIDIDYIKQFIQQYNYTCLSSLYDFNLKLLIKCDKNHVYKVWWNGFQQGGRCPYCSKNKKLNIYEIRKIIRKEKYDILSPVYKNAHTKYWFKCPNGHYFEKSWTNFQQGQRCTICNGYFRYDTIDKILKYFEMFSYKVIEYDKDISYNTSSILKVKCPMSHIYYTTFGNFKYGYRCRDCFCEKLKDDRIGDNNPGWKGGISCEPYCEQWLDKEYKESIKERDGYKCLNPECNKISNKLAIHHIDYNKKNCNPNNLITICMSCNAKANKNRKWHKEWYKAILYRRYYEIRTNIY